MEVRSRGQDEHALAKGALKAVRTALFWLHFAVGTLVATVVIVMASTGTLMAFEHEILAGLDARWTVQAPEDQREKLPPSQLLSRVESKLPSPSSIKALTLSAREGAPALVATKGGGFWLVDPYRGEILTESRARAFFSFVEDVHRNLALARFDRSAIGKTVTGWTAVGVVVLGLSGLVLWWPRGRGEGRFRRVLFFRRAGSAAARDFNWHNVIGIWTAPVLVVIALCGISISFDGVKRFVNTTFGVAAARAEPPPPLGGFDLDVAYLEAIRRVPDWTAVNVRWPARDGKLTLRVRTKTGTRPDQWNFLTYDIKTGAVASFSRYEEAKTGTKILGWGRWLHTGQALGVVGQALWALSAIGATGLAWTGLSMAWRRTRRTIGSRTHASRHAARSST